MNVRLLSTIDEIIDLARCDHSYSRLISCTTRSVFDYELENDAELIGPLVELTQQMVYSIGICDATGRLRTGMALEQAILNAMYHGNLELSSAEISSARDAMAVGLDNLLTQRMNEEPYRDRRVFVEIAVSRDEACFIIRDDGPGFDVTAMTPEEEEAIIGEGGRGLVLMRSFMDDVTFNEKGNEVLLVKRRSTDAASQAHL